MEVETPVKAIKMKCLECANWTPREVTECPMTDCPLWPYRKGKRPTAEEIAIVKTANDQFAEQKESYRKKYGRDTRFLNETREDARRDSSSNSNNEEVTA